MTVSLEKRLQNADAIRIDVSMPSPGKPGYLTCERFVTCEEFAEQVKQALRAIPLPEVDEGCDAYSLAESFYVDRGLLGKWDIFGKNDYGRVFAIPSPGHCEGELIRFVLLREDGTYLDILHIKYIWDMKGVWDIARKLSDCLQEGLYN